MKLVIKRATILKVMDQYYVYDDNELIAKLYNREDAKELADKLNKMHNNH